MPPQTENSVSLRGVKMRYDIFDTFGFLNKLGEKEKQVITSHSMIRKLDKGQLMLGDSFLQLHQFTLPSDIEPGEYQLVVGVYTLPDGRRLPLTGDAAGDTLLPLTSITVAP